MKEGKGVCWDLLFAPWDPLSSLLHTPCSVPGEADLEGVHSGSFALGIEG